MTDGWRLFRYHLDVETLDVAKALVEVRLRADGRRASENSRKGEMVPHSELI